MKHTLPVWTLILIVGTALAALAACAEPEEHPLPEVTGVEVELGPESIDNPGQVDTVVVSWQPSKDSRVQGYAIYRAEQGIGEVPSEKSEFALQAVTIATQYVDDEVRTSVRYPTVHYFYRISTVGPETSQGPMSPEVSIEFSGSK